MKASTIVFTCLVQTSLAFFHLLCSDGSGSKGTYVTAQGECKSPSDAVPAAFVLRGNQLVKIALQLESEKDL
ncbi:hypothetical protein DER45DRAFT_557098 [Fusarium avenaceum]|nr:hypothetical protein DER45DRAFT_557098 [Fusarium avenaceum]